MTNSNQTDSNQSDTPRIIPCPTCQKAVKWTPKNAYRPFCSERCKLIDFGEWADEGHVISGNNTDISSTNSEDEYD
ncbi:MAG: DNA gyrase inhibitor YacG [Pseudomonadales bacterium]|nr:DNA gyrase inhibitor YacG [Pseudomonadales bacterium]